MSCKGNAIRQGCMSNMDNDPQSLGSNLHPTFGNLLSFLDRERHPLTGCATDKCTDDSFRSQPVRVSMDRFQVHGTVKVHRGERSRDEAFGFFH